MKNIIDVGVDLDFDGHCDLCGRFVDELGHHKASLIFDEEFQYTSDVVAFQKMIKDYDESTSSYALAEHYYVVNPYQRRELYGGAQYWNDVKNYTNPDIKVPYSGTSMNYYLKTGRLYNPSLEDVYLMENKIRNINAAIKDFETSDTIVTYRGLSTYRDDKLCKTLDEAFAKLKNKEVGTFVDKGFLSSTTSLKYAYKLGSALHGEKDTSIIFSIVSPKGIKCMPLSGECGTTFYPNETEVLFSSGQKFEIIAMSKKRKKRLYKYRVVLLAKGN